MIELFRTTDVQGILVSELPPELSDLDQTLEQFLQSEFIRDGYGVVLPLEVVQDGHLGKWLLHSEAFEGYGIENAELGPLLDKTYNNFYKNFGISKEDYVKLLGMGKNTYWNLINNKVAVNLNGVLKLPELTPEIIKKITTSKLTNIQIEELKNRNLFLEKKIERLLINKDSKIRKRGNNPQLNFQVNNLVTLQFAKRKFVVIPTSIWETPKRQEVVRWLEKYIQKNGRSPPQTEFVKRFRTFFIQERKKYNRSYNDILKVNKIPINLEFKYNWENITAWEVAKQWAQGFYVSTLLFNPLFGKKGRSPKFKEISHQFGGLIKYLNKKGIPGNPDVNSYNKLLTYWDLQLNFEFKSDWTNVAVWKTAKKWAQGFYVSTLLFNPFFGKKGRSPRVKEIQSQFGGIRFQIKKNEYLANKNIDTYNKLLEFWELPCNKERKNNWDNLVIWQAAEHWAYGFYIVTSLFNPLTNKKGRSPSSREINAKFPGIRNALRRKGLPDVNIEIKSYNELLKYWNLPINSELKYNWDDLATWQAAEQWAYGFYIVTSLFNPLIGENGRTSTSREINAKFPGIRKALSRKGLPDVSVEIKTYNELLKYWHLPINSELKYKWDDPMSWQAAEQWAQRFYIMTSIFNPIIGEIGRSPTSTEIQLKFPGILRALKRPLNRDKIPNLNEDVMTHNDLIKSWEIPPNHEIEYNWKEILSWEEAKRWAYGFYIITSLFNPIFHEKGRSPHHKELTAKFGGILNALKAHGIPGHIKKIKKYCELLEFWDLPIIDQDKFLEEGNLFDSRGKKCLDILYLHPIKNYKVFHPLIKKYKKNFIIPDGIVHDFSQNPLKGNMCNFFLENGQKFDKIIEFKRCFASMGKKDWLIYTEIAKEIDVYLLRGKAKKQVVNSCVIRFYSLQELISFLYARTAPDERAKLEPLIRGFYNILNGVNKNAQLTLDNFK